MGMRKFGSTAPPFGKVAYVRRLLVQHATQNAEQRRKTREEIAQELGINVCRWSLIKAFEKELYHRRKATEKPLLTPEHMHNRVIWAWEHLNWTEEQWASVGWSDEMSCAVSQGQVYVTRRQEEKYLPECCVPKFKKFSAAYCWAIISLDYKGPLIIFTKAQLSANGTIDSQVYIREVLPYVQALSNWRYQQGKSFIFMEDNSSVHNSKATRAAKQQLSIYLAEEWEKIN